jgi:hypothetical protein
VLAAVNQNGTVLQHASDRLKSDINFCIECAKQEQESIAYFEGEAKEIFQAHNNDIVAVEAQQQQNKADEALLAKIKKSPTTPSFKMKLNF